MKLYLDNEKCADILNTCISTSAKLLVELNDLKLLTGRQTQINNIRNKLKIINDIIENIDKYNILNNLDNINT